MSPDKLTEYVDALLHAVGNSEHADVLLRGFLNSAYMDGYEDGFKAGHTMGATAL